MASFETPILLIIFNRPETTRQVLSILQKVKPSRLYVAADGPREGHPTDERRCQEVRDLVESSLNWDCECTLRYLEQNKGCGLAPPEAISWFFDQEEAGIILEDDIVPDLSFFPFCQELLTRYAHDHRIMQISGTNFLFDWHPDPNYSYYFSKPGSIWGWATWRRAWTLYDREVKLYGEIKKKGYLQDFFFHRLGTHYIVDKLEKVYKGETGVTYWDYQWDLCRFLNNGLSIVPALNLVGNIGFGNGATHTQQVEDRFANNPAKALSFPLMHPPFVLPHPKADEVYFENIYAGSPLKKAKQVVKRIIPRSLL